MDTEYMLTTQLSMYDCDPNYKTKMQVAAQLVPHTTNSDADYGCHVY